MRRTGGRSGEVSIDFETSSLASGVNDATDPDDYTPVSDTLTWADGDVSDKEIRVPISPQGSDPEEAETFAVTLLDAVGGAGVGTQTATVEIAADGSPNGLFSIEGPEGPETRTFENAGTVEVVVARNYYFEGSGRPRWAGFRHCDTHH